MKPSTIRALAACAGLVLISVGTGMIYLPAGVIVAGVVLMAAGVIGHIRGGAGE